jgi:hypothetical protein
MAGVDSINIEERNQWSHECQCVTTRKRSCRSTSTRREVEAASKGVEEKMQYRQ